MDNSFKTDSVVVMVKQQQFEIIKDVNDGVSKVLHTSDGCCTEFIFITSYYIYIINLLLYLY